MARSGKTCSEPFPGLRFFLHGRHCDGRCGFFHDRRLDVARPRDVLAPDDVRVCDRKLSGSVRQLLSNTRLGVLLTPVHAPNANAYAKRFVRSIKEESLDRLG